MSSARWPRTTYKEKTMLKLLHVYTSTNHGSSVLRYWPVTHVTHSHLSTHLTHDPWPADPLFAVPDVCRSLIKCGLCLISLFTIRLLISSTAPRVNLKYLLIYFIRPPPKFCLHVRPKSPLTPGCHTPSVHQALHCQTDLSFTWSFTWCGHTSTNLCSQWVSRTSVLSHRRNPSEFSSNVVNDSWNN